MPLDYTYLKVLEAVAVSPNNQRSIAKRAGLSLGMVNLVLKRLIQMGYIRIKNLNGKRLSYLLTPAGVYEKTKQSCHYIQRILSAFTKLSDAVTTLIDEFILNGYTHFIILGKSEIGDLVSLLLSKNKANSITWEARSGLEDNLPQPESLPRGTLLLDCSYKGAYSDLGVAVIEKLVMHRSEQFLTPMGPVDAVEANVESLAKESSLHQNDSIDPLIVQSEI